MASCPHSSAAEYPRPRWHCNGFIIQINRQSQWGYLWSFAIAGHQWCIRVARTVWHLIRRGTRAAAADAECGQQKYEEILCQTRWVVVHGSVSKSKKQAVFVCALSASRDLLSTGEMGILTQVSVRFLPAQLPTNSSHSASSRPCPQGRVPPIDSHWTDSADQYVARPPERSNTPAVVKLFSLEHNQTIMAAASCNSRNRPRGIFESM